MQTMTRAEILQHIIDLAEELDMLQQKFLKRNTYERFSMLEAIAEEAEGMLENIS